MPPPLIHPFFSSPFQQFADLASGSYFDGARLLFEESRRPLLYELSEPHPGEYLQMNQVEVCTISHESQVCIYQNTASTGCLTLTKKAPNNKSVLGKKAIWVLKVYRRE